MGDTSKGDLIGVRKIPLDANMIADIMAIYIRNEPTYEPYALPLFRIHELNKIVSGQCEDDGDMLVVLGALFVLCMYHATAPAFAPDALRDSASILMSVASECLAALELSKKCSYAHPVETVEHQRYVYSSEDVLYDTFRHSLEFSREILREITRCVRTARDRKVNRVPTEAVQPNILLFMCAFSLAHMAAVLGAQNQLDMVPGIKETLLLLLSVRLGMSVDKTDAVRLPNSCPSPDEHEKGAKMQVRGYFLVRSYELISRLNCVTAQLVLDKPEVYELSLLHKKINDNTDHAVVVYAKTQSQPCIDFLHSQNPFQDKITTVMLLETTGNAQKAGMLGIKPKQKIPVPRGYDTDVLLSCGGSFRTHKYDVDSAIRRTEYKRQEELRKEREKERTEQMQRDSNKRNMAMSMGVGAGTGGGTTVKMPISKQKQEEDAALAHLTTVGVDITADEFDGLCILDKFSAHEQDVYARIKPVYRYAYVATRECREHSKNFIKQYFVPTYDPLAHREFHLSLRADRYDANRSIPQNEIRDDVECLYFNQTKYAVPRFMNPACGQYWLCVAVVKYILELSDVSNTELFASDTKARLKDEIRTIKNLKAAFDRKAVQYEQVVETTTSHEFGEHAHHAAVSNIDKGMLTQLLTLHKDKEKELHGKAGPGHGHRHGNGNGNRARGQSLSLKSGGSGSVSTTLPRIDQFNSPVPGENDKDKDGEKGKEKEKPKSRSVFARSRESKAQMKISKILNNASDAVDKDIESHPTKNAHTPNGGHGRSGSNSGNPGSSAVPVVKESSFPTSLIEKRLFEHHRTHAPLELTLKDRLVLAGRLGRAEACLDIVHNNEQEAKLLAAKKKFKPKATVAGGGSPSSRERQHQTSSPGGGHRGSVGSPSLNLSMDDSYTPGGHGHGHGHGNSHGHTPVQMRSTYSTPILGQSTATSAYNSAYNSPRPTHGAHSYGSPDHTSHTPLLTPGHGHGSFTPVHSHGDSAALSSGQTPVADGRGHTHGHTHGQTHGHTHGHGSSPTQHLRGGHESPNHGESPDKSLTGFSTTARPKLNESKLLVATVAVQTYDRKPADPKAAAEKEHHVQMILKQRHLSVVWSSCAAVLDEPDPTAAFAKKTGALTAMAPEMAVKEYARQIQQWKDSVVIAQQMAKRSLQDQQEAEQGKLKTFKFTQLKQVRDTRKHWLQESVAIKQHIKEEKLDAVKQANIMRREEKARKEKANAMERERINTLKEFDRQQKANDEMDASVRQQYELIRLKAMTDKNEYNEILRRIEEEARMKYLEERRREIEKAEERRVLAEEETLKKRQEHVKEIAQSTNERLRFGTFRYYMDPHGVRKLGFYDHTKKVLPPYTEYEDENGVSYYYDKVTGQSTYKRPEGAEIISAKEEERREYDRQYGQGSFDAMHAHMAMMNSVNNYGGYTDAEGTWIPVNGYYDENGEFFVLAEDTGNGKAGGDGRRPKAVGTLDFMV